ncbi:MAG: amino acid kinase [Candidatus Methanogaster sp.]|uniref:Amino acid kinase n=1 Tax=Candidatus Methanogaster sp. TaxID=3386292 RepID=A0AC61KXY6_9EURY|nr:MAG: amino acid kinase [ANME-2 cluster archaeon]
MIVVKIGGSLIESARELVRELRRYASDEEERIIIVPGGGVFADTVRTASDAYGISDEACHWMAVLAMDQYGHYLADGTEVSLITDIRQESIREGLSVLLVYDLLKRFDRGDGGEGSSGGSGIEHTWNATSDTIAGMVASRLGAAFIKATDVDGVLVDGVLVSEIGAEELLAMSETCVDLELPRLLISRSLNCRVVNGGYPDRVVDAIRGGFLGTMIVGG